MDDRLSQLNRAVSLEFSKHKPRRRWAWLCLVPVLGFLLFLLPYFLVDQESNVSLKFVSSFKRATGDLKTAVSLPTSVFSAIDQPTNFLILGVPGKGNDAPELTDTIALAMYQPEKKTVTLISLPRDLWVAVPRDLDPETLQKAQECFFAQAEDADLSGDQCLIEHDSGVYAKINSLYVIGKKRRGQDYGLRLIKQKVSEITGQKIDYFLMLDLTAVKEIIDNLAGLNIMVKKDIYDPRFPGPNHSYQTFEIKAGWRYLDGETALKYIRSRHSLYGDFDRIERQQQIIWAIKQKVMGLNPLTDLPKLLEVFKVLNKNIITDVPITDYLSLWQSAKNIPPESIKKIVVDNNPEKGLLISNGWTLGEKQAYILTPKAGTENYSAIRDYIKNNLP